MNKSLLIYTSKGYGWMSKCLPLSPYSFDDVAKSITLDSASENSIACSVIESALGMLTNMKNTASLLMMRII